MFNTDILKNTIIKYILENNFNIYGRFVRDFIVNYDSNLLKCNEIIVHIYGDIKYKNLIESFLDKYTKQNNILFDNRESSKEPINKQYSIEYNNNNYCLDILYLDIINKNNLAKYLKICIDIDCICIDKNNIFILDIDKYCNPTLPLFEIIKKINDKKFNIIVNYIYNKDMTYIKHLITNGFINLDNKIKKCLCEHLCCICYDSYEKNYCELPCGHKFHFNCINKYFDLAYSKNYYNVECPYCKYKMFIYEIL